jgi:hypothetical protein
MATIYSRKTFGLFDNGCFQDGTNKNFTSYSTYKLDSLSGDTCIAVDYNVYGSATQGSEFIKVDPENKYYQLGISVKTIQNNYLGNPGSGHLGIACYDINKSYIAHHQSFSILNTTLTRAASPGDTTIYIARGDWSNSPTAYRRSINFYPAGSPYSIVGGYSRFNVFDWNNGGYQLNGITDIGGGEWSVSLSNSLPNWGYSLPIGTPVGNTYAGSTYTYVLGNPNYPSNWTTYVSSILTGYSRNVAPPANKFRDQTKFIKFLNLRNYNYRTQNSGNSARYLIDNIIFVECKGNAAYPNSLFSRSNVL